MAQAMEESAKSKTRVSRKLLASRLGLHKIPEKDDISSAEELRRGIRLKESAMAVRVHDVAKYILEQCGPMTHMKLQKLCYYAQAWALVWDDEPLFDNEIEAWANGPVVRNLYAALRGNYSVEAENVRTGDSARLNDEQRETIDEVIRFYGDKSSQWLSDLTHMESPWLEARKGIPMGERGETVISHASMAEYYGSL